MQQIRISILLHSNVMNINENWTKREVGSRWIQKMLFSCCRSRGWNPCLTRSQTRLGDHKLPESPEIANFLWKTRGIWISLKRNLIWLMSLVDKFEMLNQIKEVIKDWLIFWWTTYFSFLVLMYDDFSHFFALMKTMYTANQLLSQISG